MNPDGTAIPVQNQSSQPVLLVPSVLMTDTDPADQVSPSLGQSAGSVAIGFVPVAGEFQAWSELISGQDYITGEPASREWAAVGVVLGVFDLEGLTKPGAVAKAEVRAVGAAQAAAKLGIRISAMAGEKAEALAVQELISLGYTIVGRHVTVVTQGGKRYMDILVADSANLIAVAIIGGPNIEPEFSNLVGTTQTLSTYMMYFP